MVAHDFGEGAARAIIAIRFRVIAGKKFLHRSIILGVLGVMSASIEARLPAQLTRIIRSRCKPSACRAINNVFGQCCRLLSFANCTEYTCRY